MIAVLVTFDVRRPMSPEEVAEMSEAIAPMYRGKPGLLAKHFIATGDGARVGGFYLWESREHAEALYGNEDWGTQAREAFGAEPDITWFDCPVVVDNRHDELLTRAATG